MNCSAVLKVCFRGNARYIFRHGRTVQPLLMLITFYNFHPISFGLYCSNCVLAVISVLDIILCRDAYGIVSVDIDTGVHFIMFLTAYLCKILRNKFCQVQ